MSLVLLSVSVMYFSLKGGPRCLQEAFQGEFSALIAMLFTARGTRGL